VVTEATVQPSLGVCRQPVPAAATAYADGVSLTQPMMVQRGKFLPLFVDDDFSSMPWWNQVTQESLEPIADGFRLPASAPCIADCLSMASGNAPGKRIGAAASSLPGLQQGETLHSEGLKEGGRFGRFTPYARLISANRNAPVLFGRLVAVSRITCYARPSTSTDWPFKFHFVLKDGSCSIKVVVWNAQAAKLHQALSSTPHGTLLALIGYRVKQWHGQLEVALNTTPPSTVFVVPDSAVCPPVQAAEGGIPTSSSSTSAGVESSATTRESRGTKRNRSGKAASSSKSNRNKPEDGTTASAEQTEAASSTAARKAAKVRAMLQKLGMWKGGHTVVLESVLEDIGLGDSQHGTTAAPQQCSGDDSSSDSDDAGNTSTSLFSLQGGKLVLNTPSNDNKEVAAPRASKAARNKKQEQEDVSNGTPTAGVPHSEPGASTDSAEAPSSLTTPSGSNGEPSRSGAPTVQQQMQEDMTKVLQSARPGTAAPPSPARVVAATKQHADGTPFDPHSVECMDAQQAAERFPPLQLHLRSIASLVSEPPSTQEDEVTSDAVPLFSVAGKVVYTSTVFRQAPLLSVDEAASAPSSTTDGDAVTRSRVPAATSAPGPWQAYRWVDIQEAPEGPCLRIKLACNSAADSFLGLAPGQCICITRLSLVAQAAAENTAAAAGSATGTLSTFACMTPESQLFHQAAIRDLIGVRRSAAEAFGLQLQAATPPSTSPPALDRDEASVDDDEPVTDMTPVTAALSPRKTRSGRVVEPPSTSTRGGGSVRARKVQASAQRRQKADLAVEKKKKELDEQAHDKEALVTGDEDTLLFRVLASAATSLQATSPLPPADSVQPSATGHVVESTLGSLVEDAAEALDLLDSRHTIEAAAAAAAYERVGAVALAMGIQLPPPNAARYSGALGELVDLLATHAAALWAHWGFYSGAGRDHGCIMLQSGQVVELKQEMNENQAAPFTGPASATADAVLLRVPVEVLRVLAAAEEACESLDTLPMVRLAALADQLAWQPSPPQGGTESEQQQWWATQHELSVAGQALAPAFLSGGVNRPGGVLFSRQRLADGHLQLAPPRELLNLPFPHGGPTAQHAFLEAQRAYLRGVLPAVRAVAALHAAQTSSSTAGGGSECASMCRPYSLQRLVSIVCCAPILSTFLEHEKRVVHGGFTVLSISDQAKAQFAAVAEVDIGSLGMSRGDHSTATGLPLVTPAQLAQIVEQSPLAVGERRRVLVRAQLVGMHAPPGETVGVSFQLQSGSPGVAVSGQAASATGAGNAAAGLTPVPPHSALVGDATASESDSLPPTQIDPDAEIDSEDESSSASQDSTPPPAAAADPSGGGFLAGVVSFLSGANSSLWGALRAIAPTPPPPSGGSSAARGGGSAPPVQPHKSADAIASPTLGVSRRTRGARMAAAGGGDSTKGGGKQAQTPPATAQAAPSSLAVGNEEHLSTVFVTGFGRCAPLTPLAASVAIADGCGFLTLSGGVSLLVPPLAPFPRPQAALLAVIPLQGARAVHCVLPSRVPYSPVLTLDAVDLGVHYSLTPEGEPEGGIGALALEDAVVPASRVCLQSEPSPAGGPGGSGGATSTAGASSTPVLSQAAHALAPVRVSAAPVPSFAHHLLHFLPDAVLAKVAGGGCQGPKGGQGGISLLRLAHLSQMFDSPSSGVPEMVFCVQLVQCGAGRGTVAYLDAAFEL